MSKVEASNWLMSHRSDLSDGERVSLKSKAKTICIASGKGGVGKTTYSIYLAKSLTEKGHKVLLIDCDYNLSNVFLKLSV